MRTLYTTLRAMAALTPSIMLAAADAGGGAASADAGQASNATTETKVIMKQNGIKRPDTGTVTGKLWDIADEESKKLGQPAPRKAVVDRYMAEQAGANVATANTQYARWVAYHGASEALKKNREAEKQAKAKAAADAKAAKDAERKAKADEKAREAAERKAAKEAEKKAAADKAAADKAAADKAAAAKAAQADGGKAK